MTTSYPAGSTTDLKATIPAATGAIIGPPTGKAKLSIASPAAYGRDCIRVNPGASHVVVRNLEIATTGNKLASAITAYGENISITNVTQTGVGKVLRTGGESGSVGTNGGTADLIYAANAGEYAIWSGGEDAKTGKRIWTTGFHFRRFDIATHGPHAARHEHTDGCTFGDATACLPGMEHGGVGPKLPVKKPDTGFAFRAQKGAFTALAINDGNAPNIQRGMVEFLALGPIQIWAGPHPDWTLEKPVIEQCQIGTLVINLGVNGAMIRDSVIGFVRLNGENAPAPTFGSNSGTFTNCVIGGISGATPNFSFVGCVTVDGKPIGQHG